MAIVSRQVVNTALIRLGFYRLGCFFGGCCQSRGNFITYKNTRCVDEWYFSFSCDSPGEYFPVTLLECFLHAMLYYSQVSLRFTFIAYLFFRIIHEFSRSNPPPSLLFGMSVTSVISTLLLLYLIFFQ